MSVSINGTSGLVFNDASTQNTAATGFGFKNRLINSAMMIDQRNAGASVTNTGTSVYTVDRWFGYGSVTSKFSTQQNSGSVTPPTGFTNYLGVVSLSSYSATSAEEFEIIQRVEGFNIADLGWGTTNAQPVTLSFWARSSLTGTFSGGIVNQTGTRRSYVFSYTITAANTWEYKTITIPGVTDGTWNTTNASGLQVIFDLGTGSNFVGTAGAWTNGAFFKSSGSVNVIGTNGATFYITGVQLEKGSTATSFDYRPYGTELALCQRYYYKLPATTSTPYGSCFMTATTSARGLIPFPVTMRIAPTAVEQTGTAGHYSVFHGAALSTSCTSVPTFSTTNESVGQVSFTTGGGLTVGQGGQIRSQDNASYLAWSAEL